MKKSVMSVLLAMAFIATSALGQQTKEFAITLNTMYRSSYLLVNDIVAYNGNVAQTDLLILHNKSGLYLDLWNSCAFDGNKSFGDEQDVDVGWMGKCFGFGINAELEYFDLIPLNQIKGDVLEPALEINRTFAVGKNLSLSPYVKGEYVGFISDKALRSAPDVRVGVRASWQPFKQVSLDNCAELLYDDGVAGNGRGALFKDCASTTVHITRQFDLIVEFTVFTPTKALGDGRKTETVLGLGCAYHF